MRFLVWLARQQLPTVVGGGFFGALWMAAQSLIPAALGEAIEATLHRNRTSLVVWCTAVLGLGLVQAAAGVMRHRRAVTNFLTADVRVQQLVARKARDLGPDLPRHVDAGEVASIGTTDVQRIGHLLDVTARGTGAIVSYLLVAVILFSSSVRLGLVVIVGAPVFALLVLPVMGPLERRQSAERFARSDASSLAADTVVGLRVLRGLGGEDVFAERYAAASQMVRRATVRTALAQSVLDALQVFVPGALLVIVTYFGAHMVLSSSLPTGKLVAFYAYAAFLTLPVQTLIEVATRWSAATVAAGRVLSVLRLAPDLPRPARPAPAPLGGHLTDPATGLEVAPGQFLVVATPDAEEGSALAARLGRYADNAAGSVRLGGTELSDLPLDVVRSRILVVDREPQLLAGSLRANVDVPDFGGPGRRLSVDESIDSACSRDIVDGLAQGLETDLPERGRTLSGGQRQRIVLAAALRANPDILVLDEPTSAVDAHTEAAIASRLRSARVGRTTVVISTSPFFLEQADAVAFVAGSVVARGAHRDLLRRQPAYRALVLREPL